MRGSRKSFAIAALLLASSGCAAQRMQATVYAPAEPRPANLLLGPSPQLAQVSQAYAGRRAWPTTDLGFVVEDVSTFTEFSFDDQSFFDRFGGGLQHESFSVRSGVLVR